jgi:ubiquinone/menaquinone biosynthesis C-methylase UbiE
VSQPNADIREFAGVDQALDPQTLIRYLEVAKALPGWRRAKQDALSALRLAPGDAVLDVGCGYGADVIEVARRVAPGGSVTGIDISDAMVAEAARRARGSNLDVDFRVGDACDLPFQDVSFDACRAETLLQHVLEPHVAFAEMVRVVKPGGRIVLLDMDLGTLVIDSDDRTTTGRVLDWAANATINGWIGRQLRRLLKDASFDDVGVSEQFIESDYAFMEQSLRLASTRAVEADELPGLTRSDLTDWWAGLDAANRGGRFYGGATAFVAWGTKPR